MFSDNQILQVSGGFENLESALTFALAFSGYEALFKDHACECVFQKTADGGFVIGQVSADRPLKNLAPYVQGDGWNRFPFEYDTDIISRIICQHLKLQKADLESVAYYGACDGAVEKGFLMEAVDYDTKGITDPGHGVVIFHTYANFYAK